jgi:hypothetical protein
VGGFGLSYFFHDIRDGATAQGKAPTAFLTTHLHHFDTSWENQYIRMTLNPQ